MKTTIFFFLLGVLVLSSGCQKELIEPTEMTDGLMLKSASISYVGSINYKGKTYYVETNTEGKSSIVYLRIKKNQCSVGDIKYMKLEIKASTLKKAAEQVCRVKTYYDNGKTILGCTATVGSVICASASIPSAGAAAALCSGTIYYTIDKGFTDCMDGISSLVASKLGAEKEWTTVQLYAGLSKPSFTNVIDKAIDLACADLKKKK